MILKEQVILCILHFQYSLSSSAVLCIKHNFKLYMNIPLCQFPSFILRSVYCKSTLYEPDNVNYYNYHYYYYTRLQPIVKHIQVYSLPPNKLKMKCMKDMYAPSLEPDNLNYIVTLIYFAPWLEPTNLNYIVTYSFWMDHHIRKLWSLHIIYPLNTVMHYREY